jgi:hypothetical protein
MRSSVIVFLALALSPAIAAAQSKGDSALDVFYAQQFQTFIKQFTQYVDLLDRCAKEVDARGNNGKRELSSCDTFNRVRPDALALLEDVEPASASFARWMRTLDDRTMVSLKAVPPYEQMSALIDMYDVRLKQLDLKARRLRGRLEPPVAPEVDRPDSLSR